MSPCSVLIFSLLLISFSKIDSATIKNDESILENLPVDIVVIDVKDEPKQIAETSANEVKESDKIRNAGNSVPDENGEAEAQSNTSYEADSRIVRNSVSDGDLFITSGPEYLPPSGSTPGPAYLPSIIAEDIPQKPGTDDMVNPRTVIGLFG